MSSIVITGGRPLKGEIQIQGSKNAVLPILAATILHSGVSRLENCPRISDVLNMISLLEELGCFAEWEGSTLIIHTEGFQVKELSKDIMGRTRASVLLLGAMLGRCGWVCASYPGGCSIGERPIDMHLDAFKQLGAYIQEKDCMLICESKCMTGTSIYLRFPSVGATENILLAAVLAEGRTEIVHAAKEPEIIALCDFLNCAGADIRGVGTGHLVIHGVKKLGECFYRVPMDRIVAGTYLAAVGGAGGKVWLKGIQKEELQSVLEIIEATGCSLDYYKNTCRIEKKGRLKSVGNLITAPFPGFPTDMQSQCMAMLTTAEGCSSIVESIFEARFHAAEELSRMGASIKVNGNCAEIYGVPVLHGANVEAKELRGGAALVIAGLMAEGTTIISHTEFIERGYVDICGDLRCMGANINCWA